MVFEGGKCNVPSANGTSPTQEEKKQSYKIMWSLRWLQSNDKEGNADNAVALKWHFQRLHKGEKGKAEGGLNNCLIGLWTFQLLRVQRNLRTTESFAHIYNASSTTNVKSAESPRGSGITNVPQEGAATGEAQPAKHQCPVTEAASPTLGAADPPLHQASVPGTKQQALSGTMLKNLWPPCDMAEEVPCSGSRGCTDPAGSCQSREQSRTPCAGHRAGTHNKAGGSAAQKSQQWRPKLDVTQGQKPRVSKTLCDPSNSSRTRPVSKPFCLWVRAELPSNRKGK
ncbi:hypothetical protein EK904_008348, partial [Melospiza melodia maxima]